MVTDIINVNGYSIVKRLGTGARSVIYLANDEERSAIAAAGHVRSSKEHTYIARMEAVFSKIWPK